MTLPSLPNPSAFLLTVFILLCLSACKEDIALVDEKGKIVGRGALEVTATFPSPAHLLLDGNNYSGIWSVAKIYEESVAQSRRMLGGNAYTTYMIGNDPRQLKHGHASLTSDSGSKIECDFDYRGQPGIGNCNWDGKQFKLILRQG